MRTAKITLGGTEYTLCCSTRAILAFEEKAGDFSAFLDQITRVDYKMFALEELLKAGYLHDKMAGGSPPEPPDGEALLDITGVDDYSDILDGIREAILGGTARKVEARAKPGKKTGAGGEPAK